MVNGDITIDDHDDRALWDELKRAFLRIGIQQPEQEEIFSLLSAILLIGNIQFVGDEKVIRLRSLHDWEFLLDFFHSGLIRQVEVKGTNELEKISLLLKVDSGKLKTALEQKLFTTNRSTSYHIALNSEQVWMIIKFCSFMLFIIIIRSRILPLLTLQAKENRDAMAKNLYAKLFTLLARKMNLRIQGVPEKDAARFIAVLDIYGFENFDNNR